MVELMLSLVRYVLVKALQGQRSDQTLDVFKWDSVQFNNLKQHKVFTYLEMFQPESKSAGQEADSKILNTLCE